ncbi:hypothetical protein VTI74DRAFT_4420 [Chaetomium olivicolor]
MSAHNRRDSSSAAHGETTTPPLQADDGESPAFSTLSGPQRPPHSACGPYRGVTEPIRGDTAQRGMTSRSSTVTVSSPGSSSRSDVGSEEASQGARTTTDPSSDEGCIVGHAGSPAASLGSGMNDTIIRPTASIPTSTFNGDLSGAWTLAWMDSSVTADQLPRSVFLTYVELFLERLYPVFPVLDRHAVLTALQEDPLVEPHPIPPSMYCFLTALSAAVIVQLNVAGSLPGFHSQALSPEMMPLPYSAHFFAAESLRARRECDFIECADEYTILASFFLFAYYGNLERSRSAWYYLREAIGFALSMGLGEPETAYALQHRSRVMLRPSIELPRVFESSDPRLIYGFVMLVKVFAAVDEEFLSAWRDDQPSGRHHTHESATPSLTTQLLSYDDDVPGALSMSEVDETQRLDILVTRQWLRALVWRLRLRDGVRSLSSSGDENQTLLLQHKEDAHHPFQTSRSVLGIISAANRASLEAHGIGMEQKIFDLASSLSDTLQNEAAALMPGEFFSGQDLLHNFVAFLASFRNQASRYLQPLLRDAAAVLAMGGIQMSPPQVGEEDEGGPQTSALLGVDGTTDY